MYPTVEKQPAQPQPPPSAAYPPSTPPVKTPPSAAYPPSTPPVQPPPAIGIPMNNNPQELGPHWSSGLLDCFSDVNTCCLVCWCPCVAFGQISEIVDKGTSSCGCNGSMYMCLCSIGVLLLGAPIGCQGIYSCIYRGKMKQDLGLPASRCEDCCVHFWCEPCALCQEYRELKSRGYDPSLGWSGNMEKIREDNTTLQMAPAPVAPTMAR